MNLVVLDGYNLNPGDLSWSGLESLAECRIYDRTSPEELVERARSAEIVVSNKSVLSAEVLAQLPRLKLIAVTATGYDVIDVPAASSQGVLVCNVPHYSTDSVAQHVFALLLDHLHRVPAHDAAIREGAWQAANSFSFTLGPLIELAGKVMGIIGPGRIGKRTAQLARAFGMQVLACGRTRPTDLESLGITWCDRETLLQEADVISLHCPLNDETAQLINRKTLQLMKPTAILINTARGGLIHEADLAESLDAGHLAAALLDVVSSEPIPNDHVLLNAPRCRLTPHVAWATVESRRRLMQATIDNVAAFLEGRPQNLVGSA